MMDNIETYDTSNYSKDHPLFGLDRCRVIGVFKDETAGIPCREFVGLSAKMYSLQLASDVTKNDLKGYQKRLH